MNRTHEVGSSNLLVSTIYFCFVSKRSFFVSPKLSRMFCVIPLFRETEMSGIFSQKAQGHIGQKACAEQVAGKAP